MANDAIIRSVSRGVTQEQPSGLPFSLRSERNELGLGVTKVAPTRRILGRCDISPPHLAIFLATPFSGAIWVRATFVAPPLPFGDWRSRKQKDPGTAPFEH